MEDRINAILSRFRREESNLIPILQQMQAEFSYLPADAMRRIAQFLQVPESRVFGVASFYAQFRFTPMGKNRVMVCRGTACHVKGAPRILEAIENTLGIKEGGTTTDLQYTLETVACIGCCALAPCIMINKEVHGKLTPAKVKEVFNKEAAHGAEHV